MRSYHVHGHVWIKSEFRELTLWLGFRPVDVETTLDLQGLAIYRFVHEGSCAVIISGVITKITTSNGVSCAS